MKNKNKAYYPTLSVVVITALLGFPSFSNPQSTESSKSSFLEEVIGTGSAKTGPTALETSYGVAALDSDAIVKSAPNGLSALADTIPGLLGEFSNGETNSNLNVRGTQGGFISFISLQEDRLPVQYSPFFSEFELRHDLAFERVEAVLGRPSGIFTAQDAAATINYISRRSTEETEGEATAFGEDVSFGVAIAGTQDNNILADSTCSITRNSNTFTGQTDYETDSYTIGSSWSISDNLAVYARTASAEDMNFTNEFTFYDIPGFGSPPGSNLGLSDEPADLTFSEIEVHYRSTIPGRNLTLSRIIVSRPLSPRIFFVFEGASHLDSFKLS